MLGVSVRVNALVVVGIDGVVEIGVVVLTSIHAITPMVTYMIAKHK